MTAHDRAPKYLPPPVEAWRLLREGNRWEARRRGSAWVSPGGLSCTLRLTHRRKQAQVWIAGMVSFRLHTCTSHTNTCTPFLSPDSCPWCLSLSFSSAPPAGTWTPLKGSPSDKHTYRGKFLFKGTFLMVVGSENLSELAALGGNVRSSPGKAFKTTNSS